MKANSHIIRLFTFSILFTVFSISLYAQSVSGSGNVVEQNRNLSGFTAIKVSSGVDLHIIQGTADKVIVKADDNLQGHIKTELNGNTLEVSAKGNIRRANAFDVYVTVKTLTEISVSAGSDVYSEGTLSFNQLNLIASSGSDVELSLDGEKLYCKISAGSDARLDGKVDYLEVTASGGSDLKAKGLSAGSCKLRVSGGSDAYVHVKGDLDMEASGASDIFYTGSPSITHSKASGSSDIHGN